jgi:hypothetical protein
MFVARLCDNDYGVGIAGYNVSHMSLTTSHDDDDDDAFPFFDGRSVGAFEGSFSG